MKSMRSKFAAILVILMSFPISALGDGEETVNPRIVPIGSRIGIVYKDGTTNTLEIVDETAFIIDRTVAEKWVGPEVVEKCELNWKKTALDLQVEQTRRVSPWATGAVGIGLGVLAGALTVALTR